VSRAEARHRAYALFGRVFVQGLACDVVEMLRALPAVAETLPEPLDPDQTAAEHHEAIGRQVFPYESAFRAVDGLLGGPVSSAVHEAYRSGGFQPDTASIEADHIGLQCAYLAHLSRAEAEAEADGRADVVERCGRLAVRFLDAHALRWWPSLAAALETQANNPWLARVATLAVELAAAHRGEVDRVAELGAEPEGPALDLDDPETRLKDIVAWLLSPVRSGLFLSLDGMARAARHADLPPGFGVRSKVLESLWYTAVDHRAVPALCEAFGAEVDATEQVLDGFAAIGVDVAAARERLDATRGVLARVAESARR